MYFPVPREDKLSDPSRLLISFAYITIEPVGSIPLEKQNSVYSVIISSVCD